MAKYIRLKDRTSSLGVLAGGVLFNNATVVKAEGEIPVRAKQYLRNGVLELTDAKAYAEYTKLQDEAKANAEKALAKKREAKKKVLEAKGIEVKEEKKPVAKKPAAKKATPKKTEDKK